MSSRIVERNIADAGRLADLHGFAFPISERWSENDIQSLLSNPAVTAFTLGADFDAMIIVQQVLDEVEILTLASHPAARRAGHATHLLRQLEAELVQKGARRWLLDVAEDNTPAILFYNRLGFARDGVRPNYYTKGRSKPVNAVLMSRTMARHEQP